MLIIVELSMEAFADPVSMTTVSALAAEHELILIGAHRAAIGDALPALRRALPRHEVVALLVDGGGAHHERAIVKELLDEGRVPVLLTTDDPTAASVAWLGADARLALPALA